MQDNRGDNLGLTINSDKYHGTTVDGLDHGDELMRKHQQHKLLIAPPFGLV